MDLAGLAQAAASLRADVLGLQEVDVGVHRSGGADLAAVAAGGMAVAFGPALRLSKGFNGRYGNALAVRGSISDEVTLRLPRQRGDEPRAAVVARAEPDEGFPATVCVTHLSVRADVARRQLDFVLDALVERAPPHLLLGDLNLRPEDVAPAVERRGLSLADPTAPTFPVDAPRIRIDHVCVSGAVAVESVSAVPTGSSDHCALVVVVAAGRTW